MQYLLVKVDFCSNVKKNLRYSLHSASALIVIGIAIIRDQQSCAEYIFYIIPKIF